MRQLKEQFESGKAVAGLSGDGRELVVAHVKFDPDEGTEIPVESRINISALELEEADALRNLEQAQARLDSVRALAAKAADLKR